MRDERGHADISGAEVRWLLCGAGREVMDSCNSGDLTFDGAMVLGILM